ncbi:MAG: 2-methylcitrate dehydratase [Pontimonas sp.]|jgi:2-methylcitrate dehydratase
MATTHTVRTHPSSAHLGREAQLAWKLAEVASDTTLATSDVSAMVANRVIDNASVAVASVNRPAVRAARDQALSHSPSHGGVGANVMGEKVTLRTSPEWAAWANGVAVRELDFHDTFLAADYSHPGDTIPALIATAQHLQVEGEKLTRAISVAYEIQVSLVKGMCLHEHKIDHIAHLAPAIAGGLGNLLELPTSVIFDAIGQALHTSTATRQSRKGEISSWKAYAPAFAGKIAIESVDRAMRGETSPSPIYEGEDGFIAWMLGGKDAVYSITLPDEGEPRSAILETYTKAHSAEYQAQALIDLAARLHLRHPELAHPGAIHTITIHTSHHTHFVIGSGSGDPQKYDPQASRETLDHSLPYIFAVALQDGKWHHEESYAPERARRQDTVDLWRKITTQEDPFWSARYHSADLSDKAFGGRVDIELSSGVHIIDDIAVANAHPLGSSPFEREDYIEKFRSLTSPFIPAPESTRFLDLAARLSTLSSHEVAQLSVQVEGARTGSTKGLF